MRNVTTNYGKRTLRPTFSTKEIKRSSEGNEIEGSHVPVGAERPSQGLKIGIHFFLSIFFHMLIESDDEHRDIFGYAKERNITHALEDVDLQHSGVSMQPDRVIGLRAPPQLPHNPTHFPIKGGQLLLPFLVLEAKREVDAPGFKAIQYQTAFPIRRFLKAQHDLRNGNQSSETCLVWFFAYQGEQWRLQASTYEDNKVVRSV